MIKLIADFFLLFSLNDDETLPVVYWKKHIQSLTGAWPSLAFQEKIKKTSNDLFYSQ